MNPDATFAASGLPLRWEGSKQPTERKMSDEIMLLPLFAWETRATPAGYGMLTIKWLPGIPSRALSQEEAETSAQSVQLGIAAEQAQSLAKSLLEMAIELRRKRKSAN
jgi:hypothetical protein